VLAFEITLINWFPVLKKSVLVRVSVVICTEPEVEKFSVGVRVAFENALSVCCPFTAIVWNAREKR
jgi:hypothetical protein